MAKNPVIGRKNIPSGFQYASFDKRLSAFALDLAILFMLVIVFRRIASFISLFAVVYFIYCWVAMDGQTIGNKLMKIKVLQDNGKSLDIATGIIRYVGYIVGFFGVGIGYLWVIFDKKKQGWHDKIAKTIVVEV